MVVNHGAKSMGLDQSSQMIHRAAQAQAQAQIKAKLSERARVYGSSYAKQLYLSQKATTFQRFDYGSTL